MANLVQLLTLDQVPEITGPTLFLWVEVISPGSRNTDLESVIRLSWPQHDQKKNNIFFVDVCTAMRFEYSLTS